MRSQESSVNYYSGIGSRQTPLSVLRWITRISKYLEDKGYTLRSGNADGADQAFQRGCERQEVYLPWPGYNGGSEHSVQVSREVMRDAFKKVQEVHPNYIGLTTSAMSLHARNVYIILGGDLKSPSKFVLYWNPGYKKTGGTYIGVQLASKSGITTYNLAIKREVEEFMWTYQFSDLPKLEENQVD